MKEPSIFFKNVSKKFSKGYTSDSLRDALMEPFRRFLNRTDGVAHKDNKEFWALKDVSFEVMPGEVVGIIGPNGSGKSTTLKLLTRILSPDKGQILVKGLTGAMIELGAGFSPDLTGKENVFLNGSIIGMTKTEVREKYEMIVEFAETNDFMDTPIKWYSSGMLARLGFAVASNLHPDVLLVDEVLSVGDIGFQKKCINQMHSFKDEGKTIIFVSHNMQAVSSICTRVIVLNHGQIVFQGETSKAIAYYLKDMTRSSSETLNKIKVIRSNLSDSLNKNNKRFNYHCGDEAYIDLSLQSTVELPNCNIGIKITKKDGTLVSYFDMRSLTGKQLSISKDQTVEILLKIKLNLVQGNYDCILLIWDEIEDKPLLLQLLSEIIIGGNIIFDGTAYLNPILVDKNIG